MANPDRDPYEDSDIVSDSSSDHFQSGDEGPEGGGGGGEGGVAAGGGGGVG